MTVEDNLSVTGTNSCKIEGTVKGNVEASTTGTIRVEGGTVEGNVIAESPADIRVKADSTIKGSIEQKGNGKVVVNGPNTLIEGNVINEGDNITHVGQSDDDVTVKGNIEPKGGGECKVDADVNLDGNKDGCATT